MQKITVLILWFSLAAFAAHGQILLEGQLNDQQGQPVVGAIVVVKGTNTYSTSSEAGPFILEPINQIPFTIQISPGIFQEGSLAHRCVTAKNPDHAYRRQ